MPTKLLVLLGILGLNLLLNFYNATQVGGIAWAPVVVGALMIVGIAKGSEGARTIMIAFAALGLVLAAIGLPAALSYGEPALVAGNAIAVAVNGFAIWCLTRPDVQSWMLKSSLGA